MTSRSDAIISRVIENIDKPSDLEALLSAQSVIYQAEVARGNPDSLPQDVANLTAAETAAKEVESDILNKYHF